MNATQMDDPLALIPNRVSGYQIINNELKNSEFINISSRFAAGGTRGTVVDLLKFMKGLNEGKILSSKSVDLMYSPTKTQRRRHFRLSKNRRLRNGLEFSSAKRRFSRRQ